MKKKGMDRLEEENKIHEEIIEEAEDEAEEDETPKRASDSYNLLVFVIALLVVAGLAAFVYFRFFMPKYVDPYTDSYTFNNFEFKKSGNVWMTQVQLGNKLISVPTHYAPKELLRIEIIGSLDDVFNLGPIYITFDPSTIGNKSFTALAAGELSLNLAQGFQRPLIPACAKNLTSACLNRPIVNCDDRDKAVIYLLESNETSITFDSNCVIVRGKDANMVKATDRLLLFWYGVMKKDERPVVEATATPIN
jgi:hypothetical protein